MKELYCLALLAAAWNAGAADTAPAGKLPDDVQPVTYALDLRIDPRADRFSGHARIRVKLTKPTGHFWLHARDIEVAKVEAKDAAGKSRAAKFAQIDKFGVAEVTFDTTLPAQELVLDFDYSAPFNAQQGQGLYKVKVGDDLYAATQMEATYARFAFPGFDEPRFKTPFDVTLTVPAADKAFANAHQVGEKLSDDTKWKTLTFAQTKPLPTYLIAFAVGPWDVNEAPPIPANAVRKTPLPLRAIGPRGSAPALKWILDETPAIVKFYEDYTQQPYPYDKLDLLATASFGGAMENAGLIVFAESLLRLDANSSAGAYRTSFEVTAHEIAHQWFGDLVTVPWWDDIWLNEAFATWAQQKATDALKPQYLGGPERVEATLGAMGNDSLLSARKVRQPIVGQGDIENAFDSITYRKGGAMLRMFEEWLGEDAYRRAMQEYLAAHRYGSGNFNDLVSVIAKASGKGETLKAAMKTFTEQPGIPLVHVEEKCTNGKETLKLSQSRYLPYGTFSQDKLLWHAPVCTRFGHAGTSWTQCFLLDSVQKEFAVATGCADWVLPNADAAGYYRFTLTEQEFAALKTQVGKLDPVEQMMVADAVSAAYRHGDLPPDALLDFMPTFATSDVPQVAIALVADFRSIHDHLANAATRPALDAWASKLYGPRLAALGYRHREGESDASTRLRTRVASLLGTFTHDQIARAELNAQGRAVLGLDGSGKLDFARADPDLRDLALQVAVQDGGAPAFEAAMSALRTLTIEDQRGWLLGAIGATRDETLGERARDYGLSPELSLDDQYELYTAQFFMDNDNRAQRWQWLQTHFDALHARLPDSAQSVLPLMAGSGWCEHAHVEAMQAFFAPRLKDIVGGDRSLAQSVEGVAQCAALKQHVGDAALATWAKAHPAPTPH